MTDDEILAMAMEGAASTDDAETTYRDFFLSLYQKFDELLKEVEAVAEIPKKNGINHFQAICRPGRRSIHLLVCDRIRRSLDKIARNPGRTKFFLPNVFVDDKTLRSMNTKRPFYKKIASDQYIVYMETEDTIEMGDDYISLNDLIDGLSSKMGSLVEWLETRHITKDDIWVPVNLVHDLRNACYLAFAILPITMEGYTPDKITVIKEI